MNRKMLKASPRICLPHRDESGHPPFIPHGGVISLLGEKKLPIFTRYLVAHQKMTQKEIIGPIGPETHIGKTGDENAAVVKLHWALVGIEEKPHLSVISKTETAKDTDHARQSGN